MENATSPDGEIHNGVAHSLLITGDKNKDLRAQYSWTLFEFARTPYVGLVFIFAFAPYFSNIVVGDPVRGQELWSLANTIAGFCVGLFAPLLGAIVDRMGRRKPWIVAVVAVMIPGCLSLWFAMPGAQGGLPIVVITLIIGMLVVAFEFGQVFHNSLLPYLIKPEGVGWLSGRGIAMGNVGAFLATVFLLFGVALPSSGDFISSFIPDKPVFGLDTANYEHDRIVGPLCGLWFFIFTIPFILWTPDHKPTSVSLVRATKEGLGQLWQTVKQARKMSNVGLYLIARMLYNDGMVAIQAYSGIVAAGVFKWSLPELMCFAISLAPFTIGGGFLCGWLDKVMGTKRTIQLSVIGTCIFALGAVSITPASIFFIPYDPASAGPIWSFPYFQTLPEIMFIVMYMGLALMITVAFAQSRAMMARISPISMMSQFFGLYSVSGWATAFLGHGMVAFFTRVSKNQQIGFSSLILLMLFAFILLTWVREERAEDIL